MYVYMYVMYIHSFITFIRIHALTYMYAYILTHCKIHACIHLYIDTIHTSNPPSARISSLSHPVLSSTRSRSPNVSCSIELLPRASVCECVCICMYVYVCVCLPMYLTVLNCIGVCMCMCVSSNVSSSVELLPRASVWMGVCVCVCVCSL